MIKAFLQGRRDMQAGRPMTDHDWITDGLLFELYVAGYRSRKQR